MGGNGGAEELSLSTKLTSHSCSSPSLEQGPHNRPEVTTGSKHFWTIRVKLELAENHRDLALFNMAIDSKLRACVQALNRSAIGALVSGVALSWDLFRDL